MWYGTRTWIGVTRGGRQGPKKTPEFCSVGSSFWSPNNTLNGDSGLASPSATLDGGLELPDCRKSLTTVTLRLLHFQRRPGGSEVLLLFQWRPGGSEASIL